MANAPLKKLVIGVDAGGSKTKACVALAHPQVQSSQEDSAGIQWTESIRAIGEGEAGPGNPRSVGFETVYENVQAAIRDAFQSAGMPMRKADSICVCMAGVGRSDQRIPVASWVEQSQLADQIGRAHV